MSYVNANDCDDLECFQCGEEATFLYLNTPMCFGCWKKQMNNDEEHTDEELEEFYRVYG